MYQQSIAVRHFLFLLVIFILSTAACTSSSNNNSNENRVAAAGGAAGNSAPPADVNKVQATPVPNGGLPDFKAGEDYKTVVRVKMLKDGWTPSPTKDADLCGSGDSSCDEFPEMENCAGTGAGNCKFLWKRGDKTLAIFTVGRPQEYSGKEIESTPKPVTSDLTGRYLHSSKHEYGVDTFLYELKAGNIAKYEVEQEGGDGVDKQGTWTANGKTVTVTLRSPESGENEVFVFERSGKDLKMIDEPKYDPGFVGFVGVIFKKQ